MVKRCLLWRLASLARVEPAKMRLMDLSEELAWKYGFFMPEEIYKEAI